MIRQEKTDMKKELLLIHESGNVALHSLICCAAKFMTLKSFAFPIMAQKQRCHDTR